MRIPYTYTWVDDALGVTIADIDCEIETEITEVGLVVTSAWIDGKRLDRGDPMPVELHAAICIAAEQEEHIIEAAYRKAGLTWRGRGGNDPGGHYVREG